MRKILIYALITSMIGTASAKASDGEIIAGSVLGGAGLITVTGLAIHKLRKMSAPNPSSLFKVDPASLNGVQVQDLKGATSLGAVLMERC